MKGYKFKLDALLKIRTLKEEQCKMHVGRLQVQINNYYAEIEKQSSDIGEAYISQEESLKRGLNGQNLHFYPYYISGKNAHIKVVKEKIAELMEQKNQKLEELKYLRANVKVIQKMKDKDQQQYKKQLTKKQFEKMEEQVLNWKETLKIG